MAALIITDITLPINKKHKYFPEDRIFQKPTSTRRISRRILQITFVNAVLFTIFSLVACQSNTPEQGLVTCSLAVDGKFLMVEVPAGSTIQQALEISAIAINNLDRIDPPTYTLITAPIKISITRIRESFEIEEVTIPFTQQKVRNESLPQGQTVLVQPGVNGNQQITYRRLYEDDVERSRTEVKRTTLLEPKPEIIMIGVQTPFSAVAIPNKLAYLTAGNAWIMHRTTGERRSLVSTADLDGRIFSLSPDGKWLLFSRKSSKPANQEINTLWIISTTDENPKPIDLKISNIIHFADWSPTAVYSVFYSTVEPRSAAPGWQANNDLYSMAFTPGGAVGKKEEIIPSNSGGIYGWWGTQYFWSSNGKQMAYSRPDSIGLVNLEKKSLAQLLSLLPFQTRSDWAWIPGISWSPDGHFLYGVNHVYKAGLVSDEASPLFDLIAISISNGLQTPLVPQSGMFTYPVTSPIQSDNHFAVAYLQSIFPEQSETSRYRLVIMDRDSSNRQIIFPSEGATGLDPQRLVWSPQPSLDTPIRIAVIYQGNLWLISPSSGQSQQITGDGLISRIDWK